MAPGEGVDAGVGSGGGQVAPVVDGMVLLTSHLSFGDQMRELPIPIRGPGEQNQMIGFGKIGGLGPMGADTASPPQPALAALGAGVSFLIPRLGPDNRVGRTPGVHLQTDLDPIDDRQPGLLGCLPEPRYPIEPVVIRYGQGLITKLNRPFRKILGMRRPVEKREVGVTVKFCIPAHPSHYIEHMFDMFMTCPQCTASAPTTRV